TSVGLFDRSRAYVGSSNMLLQTLDGGEHWTTLPMGFVESNVNRIVAMPDGLGYGFGGSDATYRVFHIHDFLLNATMRTLGLSSGLDANDEIRTARVKVETDLPPGGAADYYISSNGGASWSKMGDLTSETEVRTEHEQDRYVSVTYGSASIPVGQRGNDLRLRIDVSTSATSPITSPVVRAAQLFQIQKYDGDTQSLSILPDVTIDLGSTSQVNLTATTAVWDTANRTMRLPVATELWTANVSGKVLTVATGHDVSGDWRDEVWVSTGDILAQNSPDYLAYAGNAESSMGPDNAVYLLDGRNGTLLAKSARFPGEVAHLALSDANGDDEPDALFATVSGTTSASIDYTWVVSLDPETLATRWTRNTTATLPTGLGAGKNATGASAAFAGIVPGSRGSGGVNEHSPSRVESVVGTTASKLEWSSLPDERGRYFLNYTIPRNWFFGPYVVEVVVDWKDSVTEGGTSREVLQAARFYDYFMVTPPGSLSPPSPVYNVHLVTWFDDWN
ncbi:MAG TPA: hypothetical protein VHH36_03990, partial [Candidatus Thermoplasmatota archaeon]|nr:hypothetical protein [Candidatus Thermoplasmatota archaeon]